MAMTEQPHTQSDASTKIRNAAIEGLKFAGLLLALSIPILVLRIDSDIDHRPFLAVRWQLPLWIAGIGFLVRFVTLALTSDAPKKASTPWNLSPNTTRYLSYGGIALLALYPVIALALVGPAGSIKWIDNFGIQVMIYVMLGWGLNIVVGLAGLLDLGYVAFYAVGAYSYALLATVVLPKYAPFLMPWAFWICLPLAGLLAALWGIILGLPVLRLRGDYLAIVTLAFGEIIRLILINWDVVTSGYAGISGIPRPSFFGLPFTASDNGFAATFGLEFTPLHRTIFLFYVILALA